MEKAEYWQSPLAPLKGGFPESLTEVVYETQINLRGNPEDADFLNGSKKSLGIALPLEPNTVSSKKDIRALWLAPDEWLIISSKPADGYLDKLAKELDGQHVAYTNVDANRVVLQISGSNKHEVMMKSCEMDLHPEVFGTGQVVQTLLAGVPVIIEQVDDDSFLVYIRNSFAKFCSEWLVDAFEEFKS